MPTIESILKHAKNEYPALHFHTNDTFHWDPTTQTIYYDETLQDALYYLLHEVGHAALNHNSYTRDIELIAMERDAWQHAKTMLGPTFNVIIPAQVIEDSLDTYRDWLHARSICPACNANGIQSDTREYTCIVCRNTWRVNQAIGCQLKRYTKKHPK